MSDGNCVEKYDLCACLSDFKIQDQVNYKIYSGIGESDDLNPFGIIGSSRNPKQPILGDCYEGSSWPFFAFYRRLNVGFLDIAWMLVWIHDVRK